MEKKQTQPHYVYENFHVDHPSTTGSCSPFQDSTPARDAIYEENAFLPRPAAGWVSDMGKEMKTRPLPLALSKLSLSLN